MATMSLVKRCSILYRDHGVEICRWKLAKILKQSGYRYTAAHKSLKNNHRNRLLAQQIWCKKLVWYQQVQDLPIYYIDESSINLWSLQRNVWQQTKQPILIKLNGKQGPS